MTKNMPVFKYSVDIFLTVWWLLIEIQTYLTLFLSGWNLHISSGAGSQRLSCWLVKPTESEVILQRSGGLRAAVGSSHAATGQSDTFSILKSRLSGEIYKNFLWAVYREIFLLDWCSHLTTAKKQFVSTVWSFKLRILNVCTCIARMYVKKWSPHNFNKIHNCFWKIPCADRHHLSLATSLGVHFTWAALESWHQQHLFCCCWLSARGQAWAALNQTFF